MFTGIVEDVGVVGRVTPSGSNLTFNIKTTLADIGVDDSISCNGICLTVEKTEGNTLTFTAISETIKKTTAGNWRKGDHINLERTLSFNGRIDGHIVQGHVDTTGTCSSVASVNGSHEYVFTFDRRFAPLIIEKGSICVNGTSLTAFDLTENSFKVAIIPYTFQHTTFQYLKPGHPVNLEFDMVGKYIERYLSLKRLPE